MDIREKTVLIIGNGHEYLVGRQLGTGNLVWSISPWDAWFTRRPKDAKRVRDVIGGDLFLFNPVAGQIRRYREG